LQAVEAVTRCGHIYHGIKFLKKLRYTQTTLKKIEALFGELDYVVRYEKGSFQSGYCIVESRKIAVINKFFDTEARINCMLEILNTIDVDPQELTDAARDLYEKCKKNAAIE
jgi:hypothetical protein